MKNLFHLLLCLWTLVPAFGQDNPEEANTYEDRRSISIYSEEMLPLDAYTMVTDANVRATPSVKGAVMATLPINSKVTIESVSSDSFTVNGYTAPWYKIAFTANNKVQKGFIWSGFIATTRVIDEAEEIPVYFLCGIGGWDEKKHEFKLQIRAVQGGKEVAKYDFGTTGDPSYDIETKIEYSSFKNVKNIIRVNTIYEACGYGSDYNIIAYGQGKFNRLLTCNQMADAGVFYATQHAILPGDAGGIAGHILVTSDESTYEENASGDDYILKEQKYSVTLYKWTGTELKKVPLK